MDRISTLYSLELAPQYDLTTPLHSVQYTVNGQRKRLLSLTNKKEIFITQGTHCTDIDGRSLKLNHIGSHYIRDHKINPHYNDVDGLEFSFVLVFTA